MNEPTKDEIERKKEGKWLVDKELMEKHWNGKGGELNKKTAVKGFRILPENYDRFKELKEKEKANNYEENNDEFIENIYYDSHGIFWIWKEDLLKWEICDDVDILNLFEKKGFQTKKPQNKTYILNLAKQEGRKNKPLELPKFCICFKNIIYDLKNKKEIPISKKYFITSPIPYDLSTSLDTPTIDKLFVEWVGEDKKDNLYEIIAYSICQEQFLQRWFALTGAGSNGKGTFNNLIIKFIGNENCVSSSIKALINRTFETSALYKKSVCFIGEADSSDLSNTNLIKQLTGEDLIRYEFKGKTCFSDKSPTTFIMNTNSLPKTPDKSDGFYRRVFVIPFPNQFQITPNLLEKIPEKEFENLTRKTVNILLNLIEKNEFTNEGTIDERRKIYEEHSSPLMIFVSENYEEEGGGFCKLREFSKEYNQFRKNKRLRILTINQIGKELREEGFEISSRQYKNDDRTIIDSAKSIIGLTKKDSHSLGIIEKEDFQDIEKNGSLSSYRDKKLPELPEFIIDYDNLPFKPLEPLNIAIYKQGQELNIDLEPNKIYSRNDLGDMGNEIIKILIENKKIKFLEIENEQ